MTLAVIMAGGRSSRMRASAGRAHKALMPLLGVTLSERCVMSALSSGFERVALAVNADEDDLLDYARGHLTALVKDWGGHLSIWEESSPLGTIGAVKKVGDQADSFLVLNVDNHMSLDLSAFCDYHRQSEAAMTIATHLEPFRMPFGEVVLRGDDVAELIEKPIKRYAISSGTYMLSKRACQMIPSGKPTSAPALFNLLRHNDEKIAAFRHCCRWVDINDLNALRRAEELTLEHFQEFEIWSRPPTLERKKIIFANGDHVYLLESGGMLSLPDRMSEGSDADELLIAFDQLVGERRAPVRYHIFLRYSAAIEVDDNGAWYDAATLDAAGLDGPSCRALAAFRVKRSTSRSSIQI